MSHPPTLEFWFDPASTYAYLSAMRIEAEAASRGVAVRWRPFLLGPIFKAQGWNTSPFNIYPAKGRYMVRDIERLVEARGLPPFRLPVSFPASSARPARTALIAADHGMIAPLMRNLFTAAFAEGRDIAAEATLSQCLAEAGAPDPVTMLAAAGEDATKDRLRSETERAAGLGIFGAPSFIASDGELFWGDDRLGDALDWAAQL
jgi:2-hydroxychromene-2-carboxylate isomerase